MSADSKNRRALITIRPAEGFQVPALVAEVGPEATKRFFEFFTVPIRNKNTRTAYYHAIVNFSIGATVAVFAASRTSNQSP